MNFYQIPLRFVLLILSAVTASAQDKTPVNVNIKIENKSDFHEESGITAPSPSGSITITDVESNKVLYNGQATADPLTIKTEIEGVEITSLEDLVQQGSEVYPNHGFNQRIIAPTNKVTVRSITGASVKDFFPVAQQNGYSQFDLNNLRDGLHILSYENFDGKPVGKKFIVNTNGQSASSDISDFLLEQSPINSVSSLSNARTSEEVDTTYVHVKIPDSDTHFGIDTVLALTKNNYQDDIVLNQTPKHFVAINAYLTSIDGLVGGIPLIIERYTGPTDPKDIKQANSSTNPYNFALVKCNIVNKDGTYHGLDVYNTRVALSVREGYFEDHPKKMPIGQKPPKKEIFSLNPSQHYELPGPLQTHLPVKWLVLLPRDTYMQRLGLDIRAENGTLERFVPYVNGSVAGPTDSTYNKSYEHAYDSIHTWKPAPTDSVHIQITGNNNTHILTEDGERIYFNIPENETRMIFDKKIAVPWSPTGEVNEDYQVVFGWKKETIIVPNPQ